MVLSASPLDSGYAGWIFTTENKWRRFGLISNKNDETLVSADKIGIGTTNAQTSKLRVTGGSISFEGSDDAFTSGGPRGFIDVDGASQTVRFGVTGGGTTDTKGISFYTVNDGTGASEVARIKSNGNVGIASTNPTERLDVNGTIKATEFTGDGSARYRCNWNWIWFLSS